MNLIRPAVQKFEKVCKGNSFLFKLYALPYLKTVSKEAKLGEITKSDKVLNIGCGALPFTSFYLNKLTGASIIAVDIDEKAVNEARDLLLKLEISEEEILPVNLSALEAVEKFDFNKVVAALQTEGKEELLEAIKEKADKKAIVIDFIIREPRSGFVNQYDNISFNKLNNYKAKKASQNFPTFDKSISIKLGAS